MAKRSRKSSTASQRQNADAQVARKSIENWRWGLLLVVAVVLTYIPVWWAGYAKAHCDLGIALLKKDQVDEAIGKFQKTLEIDPRNPEAHYYFGVSLLKKSQFEDAEAQFQDALRWKPDYPNAQHNLDQARLLANQKASEK